MNLNDFDLDSIEIITTRSNSISVVNIIFVYDSVNINATKACFRSLESELNTQGEILASLGFSDKQIKELSYE